MARSKPYTYEGIGMSGVQGRPYFFTGGRSIFLVNAAGEATIVASGSSAGVSAPFTFRGRPTAQLIDASGAIYRLFDAPCGAMIGRFGFGTCATREGTLGTLRMAETMLAMTDDERGNLYTLVAPPARATGPSPFGGAACPEGCLAQRIDVDKRLVVAERAQARIMASVVSLHHDPGCDRLVATYRAPLGPGPSSTFEPTGDFAVEVLDLR